jgi:hypothetical protein
MRNTGLLVQKEATCSAQFTPDGRLLAVEDRGDPAGWPVLDLIVGGARGLGLTDFEHRQLADMRAAKRALLPEEMTA